MMNARSEFAGAGCRHGEEEALSPVMLACTRGSREMDLGWPWEPGDSTS